MPKMKRLPKLKDLQRDGDGPKRPQTIAEQIAIAQQWAGASVR